MRKIKNKYKYILMLIVVLNIPLLVKAQPANPAFSDDAFYTCVVDSYNSTNNKQYEYTANLTDEELSTITYLTCNKINENNVDEFYEIGNTTGIDKLVNLESLSLNSTGETIDLSKNINLVSLDIVNAYNLKNLDLSKNVKLKTAYVFASNMTSLDLSKNVNLEELNLWTDIKEMDLSKNVKLERLTINVPKSITKLNLDKNVKLKTLILIIDSDNISVYLTKGVETRLIDKNGDFIDISNSSKDSIVKIEKHMFSTVNDGSTVLTLADGKKINVFSGNYVPTDTSKKNIVKQNVKVENTASSLSIVLIIFSILLIIAGLIIMIKTKKNIKK